MSKSVKPRKAHQCVACGFIAVRGSFVGNHFLCRACETESIGDDEARYEEETFLEILRIEQHVGRCDFM